MTREIEVERTARILKQAEPGHAPPRRAPPRQDNSLNPTLIVAIVAGIAAFVALVVTIFAA